MSWRSGLSLTDILKNSPRFDRQMVDSAFNNGGSTYGALGVSSVAALAASYLDKVPFAARSLIGVASCDAGSTSPVLPDNFLPGVSESILRNDTLNLIAKEYPIELKPLLSALHIKPFTMTVLRAFILHYSQLLQPKVEDDDDDILTNEERHVDLVVPFKKSVKQILRETSVVTTRRVLERFAVHHFSQRTAWKLLKDVPLSALRKSDRGMPFYTYTFCVGRSTFRGHVLAVAASWLVQVGIECYRCARDIVKTEKEEEDVDIVVYRGERAKVLGKRVCGVTVRCGASLVFASIGAGIGVTLLRPRTGQSLGCLLGDMVGPIIVSFCFANVPQLEP